VGTGGGSVQPARSTTDAQGIARAEWTLGLRAGAPGQTASATLAGLPPVSFSATATTAGVVLQWVRTGGDGQTGPVGSVLPDSLAVQLRTPAGAPVQGADVVWAVTAGGGQLSPTAARTDAQGRARAAWTMGTAVGPAQATARVDEGVLTFSAVARVGAPAVIQVVSGNGQSAVRGIPLENPLAARVEDAYGNPLAGVPVRWSVTAGGGDVERDTSITGGDGTARTRWAMGFTPGENTAAATVEGVGTALFTALGAPGVLQVQIIPENFSVLKIGSNRVGVDVDFFVSVKDGYGNHAVGAALTWGGGAYQISQPTGWDTVTVGHGYAGFDLDGEVYEDSSGWVQFEEQRHVLVIPKLYPAWVRAAAGEVRGWNPTALRVRTSLVHGGPEDEASLKHAVRGVGRLRGHRPPPPCLSRRGARSAMEIQSHGSASKVLRSAPKCSVQASCGAAPSSG
jgi:hypothetical protein